MSPHHAAAKAKSKHKVKILAGKGVGLTNNAGGVSNSHVHLDRGTDEVVWSSNGQKRATIVFATSDGSPFEDVMFEVPAGGSVSSGAVRNNAPGNGKSYKYTVIGNSGSNDPDVIIDN
jgi:hypothetical protein